MYGAAGWAHLQICASGCSWHWRCRIEWSKQTPRVVIPNESEGPPDCWLITQPLRDAICNCGVPRRTRLGMTGVSAQYWRHQVLPERTIPNESKDVPIPKFCTIHFEGKALVAEVRLLVRVALYLIPSKSVQMRLGILISILAVALIGTTRGAVTLPMRTVFKGQDRFEQLVVRAKAENWKMLPIGERTAVVGQAMVGTPYRSFTLEIDNRVESPSVNFTGLDCWTFFEAALAFARMLDEPETNWTPAQLLRYIEIDRYRHAECTGEYLSRLHYLEDWLYDNDRRGLLTDLTRSLGGVEVPHSAREMTNGWRHYRYLVHNRGLLRPLAEMEAEVSSRPLYEIPKSRVAAIESRLRSGDIIGIVSRDGRYTSLRATSHVGLALRTADGTLHFMHASAPHNYGRVVIDTRLSSYLYRYSSDTGILVARPLH